MKKKAHEPARPRGKAPGTPQASAADKPFSTRTKDGGLANESRPGLGTRISRPDRPSERATAQEELRDSAAGDKPRATPRGYEEPPPAPREQESDSFEHQQERDTGVSGHSSAD